MQLTMSERRRTHSVCVCRLQTRPPEMIRRFSTANVVRFRLRFRFKRPNVHLAQINLFQDEIGVCFLLLFSHMCVCVRACICANRHTECNQFSIRCRKSAKISSTTKIFYFPFFWFVLHLSLFWFDADHRPLA